LRRPADQSAGFLISSASRTSRNGEKRADYPGQHAEAIVKSGARLYDLGLKDFDSVEVREKNADNPLRGLAEPTG
jgi:hypothetical protein